jgi:hypothetical protein
MATCANCTGDALYTYTISDGYRINYCQYHLPRFLLPARAAGMLPLFEEPVEKPAKAKKAVTQDSEGEEPTDAPN